MGAGSGYWGRMLQLRGTDIKCFDLHVPGEEVGADCTDEPEERKTWINVEKGTPEVYTDNNGDDRQHSFHDERIYRSCATMAIIL
jgi:hypothetical protein